MRFWLRDYDKHHDLKQQLYLMKTDYQHTFWPSSRGRQDCVLAQRWPLDTKYATLRGNRTLIVNSSFVRQIWSHGRLRCPRRPFQRHFGSNEYRQRAWFRISLNRIFGEAEISVKKPLVCVMLIMGHIKYCCFWSRRWYAGMLSQ